MAVDTAARRFSMISFGGERFGARVPDATDMDEKSDRANELYLYFGIDPSTGSNLFGDRRRRAVVVLMRRGMVRRG